MLGVRIYCFHQTSWCFRDTKIYLGPGVCVSMQLHLERFSEMKPNILIRSLFAKTLEKLTSIWEFLKSNVFT